MAEEFSLEVQVGEARSSSASFSSCGRYRYTLSRRWAVSGAIDLWIGANPSTADTHEDDHTVRKMIGFGRRWGSAGFKLFNLHAFVATEPAAFIAAFEKKHVQRRMRLRTANIGGIRGTGHGRREWELQYYPDVFRAAARAGVDP